jgi:hypothetical protein
MQCSAYLSALWLLITCSVHAADATYQPQLFKSLRLVYEDSFDSGKIHPDFWEIRQNTTWAVQDGALHGSQSNPEFQKQKIAQGDKAHAGFKPVIWLKQVPEHFVCRLRMRYDAKAYAKGFPLLDVGHHIHTLIFAEKATTLTIKKDLQKLPIESPRFTLNEWHDVVIELKKGTLLLQIDGVKHLFESPNIDMSSHAQIDFKAVDLGTCQIDHIQLWEGH